MLDTATKQRINTARDILVGKVPDPKSQVEQITIALIYKFMDDMDAEAEELGGKRTFFVGKFTKYGWRKIFDPKLSGFDMLNLYSEAIQQMNLIPSIPQLFRDIFKNAYLPYRDPETLKAFLKIINEFTYDHSERLGDAFEYLLSVLGSQGDAGQFRTPRHIIDFMVRVVNPNKNERVLDPACGTAGFLISSYKHILQQNSKDGKSGRGLTTDDRKKLAQNFRGYDISPDMVRLSLVNMYLHGFAQPSIYEYDTLTSEERWNEYYDVIMANPPFMTPKGGIRPHKRFGVQSNRSEVLFVDYIAEHLTPTGRGAIIVPEGVIFQGGTAYKQIRKILVEKYLYAVVSLPANIFQPYSGVKTSILLLDKTLAKKTDSILFVKVQNDGFDLGAQRRPIDKSDLYFAEELLKYYKQHLQLDRFDKKRATTDAEFLNINDHSLNREIPLVKIEASQYLHIAKSRIASDGGYNLNGDRYLENKIYKQSQFPLVEIGELCDLINGRAFKPEDWENQEQGGLPIIRIQNLNNHDAEFNYYSKEVADKVIIKTGDLLFSWSGSKGTSFGAHIWHGGRAILNQHIFRVEHKDVALRKYLYYALNKAVIEIEQNLHGGVGLVHITKGNLEKIKIPLPPIEIQRAIIAKIENYQNVIDGALQVIKNYKSNILINSKWPMVELSEVCEINPKKSEIKDYSKGFEVSFVPMADIEENNIYFGPKETKSIDEVYNGYTYFKDHDVLLAKVTPCFENGKAGVAKRLKNGIGFGSSEFFVFRSKGNILPEWIYLFVSSDLFRQIGKEKMTGTGGLQRLPRDFVESYKIPLPTMEEQEEIIRQLEMERLYVHGNRQLIFRMQQKIKDTMSEVWGEEQKTIFPEHKEEIMLEAE